MREPKPRRPSRWSLIAARLREGAGRVGDWRAYKNDVGPWAEFNGLTRKPRRARPRRSA